MLKSSRSNSVQWNVAGSLLVITVLALATLVLAPTTFAANRYVAPSGQDEGKAGLNPCSDPNMPCRTIKSAVEQAESRDTIFIDDGEYFENIVVEGKHLNFRGVGGFEDGKVTYVNGNEQGSVFRIESGASAAIYKLYIYNGEGDPGGGITNYGTLTVEETTVAYNDAASPSGAGGIFSNGNLHLGRVWLYHNVGWGLRSKGTATLDEVLVQLNEGGGIASQGYLHAGFSAILDNKGRGVASGGGTPNKVDMLNVTISGNNAPSEGGSGLTLWDGDGFLKHVTITANGLGNSIIPGIAVGAGGGPAGVTLYNSIVAGNGDPNKPQCGSTSGGGFTDGGYNVLGNSSCITSLVGFPSSKIGVDPMLASLGNNGGFTPTHALQPGSPAIDLVPGSQCISQDQRNSERPLDGNNPPDGKKDCDAGAYEYQPPGYQPPP